MVSFSDTETMVPRNTAHQPEVTAEFRGRGWQQEGKWNELTFNLHLQQDFTF